ncbi:MAG: GNAT family N-acetyltransferase [Aureliella sp.]
MQKQQDVSVGIANLASAQEAGEMLRLLDVYAQDIKGGGEPLSEYCKANLTSELLKRDNCCVFIARVDGVAVGLSICFENFSTFACRPLLNIHDFLIAPEFRGRGISKLMLAAIEEEAARRECCKMTLEVLEHNEIAVSLYKKFGFEAYELDPSMGRALFFEKPIG